MNLMRVSLYFILLNGIIFFACSACSTANDSTSAAGNFLQGPRVEHKETISGWTLGLSSWVETLSFSHDSRYLAIVIEPNVSSATLIIWDIEEDREQTRIEGLPPFGDWPQVEPLWSVDDKSITFGNGGVGSPIRFWSPMTGNVVRDLEIDKPAVFSRYNRSGTKLLVNTSYLLVNNPKNRTFRIYDTRDWTFKDYDVGNISTQIISWTADDKVIVAGYWGGIWGSTMPGVIDGIPVHRGDVIVRLISPSGLAPSRSIVINQGVPMPGHPDMFLPGGFNAGLAIPNYVTDQIVIGWPIKVLDCRTLSTLFTYKATPEELQAGSAHGGLEGVTFSADGKYLFLVGPSGGGASASLILDSQTGVQIGSFPGGRLGIAASPDGKLLAVGNRHSVEIYNIESDN